MEIRATTIRQLSIGAVIILSIIAIPLFRTATSYADTSLATLYTIPVAIATFSFNPLVALAITTLALISHSIDAWIVGMPILPWAAQTFVLISIAFIGIRWTQQERGIDELAAKTRRLSEERVQLVDKLTESRLEREQFVGAIMHETKDILESVLDYAADMARKETFCSDEEERALETIIGQATHLRRLIGDMQTASQAERGKFTVSQSPGELSKLVSRVVLELQTLSPQHDLILNIPDEDVESRFDYGQIERVLQNLIRNAVNYSPHGGKIEVSLNKFESRAQISVEDHGIGIAQIDLPRLFKPYVRLAPAKNTSGIGLGLFVSKAIVEAHGGKIWAESKLGYGSVFHFDLPLTQRAQIQTPHETSSAPP